MEHTSDAEKIRATESINILNLHPGHWRELASTINLGEGKIEKHNSKTFDTDETRGPVIIKEGSRINVFGENERNFHGQIKHEGRVRIKIASQENRPGYWVEVPATALQGKKIDIYLEE